MSTDKLTKYDIELLAEYTKPSTLHGILEQKCHDRIISCTWMGGLLSIHMLNGRVYIAEFNQCEFIAFGKSPMTSLEELKEKWADACSNRLTIETVNVKEQLLELEEDE